MLLIVERYCLLLHTCIIDAIYVHICLICHTLRGHIGVPNAGQCQFVMVIHLRISRAQHQLIQDPEVHAQGLVYPFVAEETLIQLILIRT